MRLVKAKKRPMFLTRVNVDSFPTVDVVIKRTMMEAYKQWFCRVASSRRIPLACLTAFTVTRSLSVPSMLIPSPFFSISGTKGRSFRTLRRVPRRQPSPNMNSSNIDSNQELS